MFKKFNCIVNLNQFIIVMQKKQSRKTSFNSLKCGLASFLATFISGILHPLQLIKTRFQSHDGKADSENQVPKYKGVRGAVSQIYKQQGLRGLYKGFYITFFSLATASSIFFSIYQKRKLYLQQNGISKMKAVTQASIQASLIATIVTQPIWVIRLRMLLNTDPKITGFQNTMNIIKQIYTQNGIRGYLKGLSLSLLLSYNGALQMYLYQGSKTVYNWAEIPQTFLDEKNFVCGE